MGFREAGVSAPVDWKKVGEVFWSGGRWFCKGVVFVQGSRRKKVRLISSSRFTWGVQRKGAGWGRKIRHKHARGPCAPWFFGKVLGVVVPLWETWGVFKN
jgi:hypothetical protein